MKLQSTQDKGGHKAISKETTGNFQGIIFRFKVLSPLIAVEPESNGISSSAERQMLLCRVTLTDKTFTTIGNMRVLEKMQSI